MGQMASFCGLGGLAMLNCSLVSKDVWVRWIGHAKLPLSVRGTSRVNMWSYENRAWVGLWLVQTRWVKWPPSVL